MISKESDYLLVKGEDKGKILYGTDVMPLREGDAQNVLRGLDIVFLMESFHERCICHGKLNIGGGTEPKSDILDRYATFSVNVSRSQCLNVANLYNEARTDIWFKSDTEFIDYAAINAFDPLQKFIDNNRIQTPSYFYFPTNRMLEKSPILELFERSKDLTKCDFYHNGTYGDISLTAHANGTVAMTDVTYSYCFYKNGYGNKDGNHPWNWYEYPLTFCSSKDPFISNVGYIDEARNLVKDSGSIKLAVEFSCTDSANEDSRRIFGYKFFDISTRMVTVEEVCRGIYQFLHDDFGLLSDSITTANDTGAVPYPGSEGTFYKTMSMRCSISMKMICVTLGDHTRWWK